MFTTSNNIFRPGRVAVLERPWLDPAAVFRAAAVSEGFIWLDGGLQVADAGRWSYMAWRPFAVIRQAADGFELAMEGEKVNGLDPFGLLASALASWKTEKEQDSPPFIGGAAGFFGYGLLSFTEPSTKVSRRRAPEGDIWIGFYDRLIAFDNHGKKLKLVTCAPDGPETALGELDDFLLRVRSTPPAPLSPGAAEGAPGKPASDFTREGYMEAVERVRRYIEAGDIYQANISQRFTAPGHADPADVYMRLRSISPAPFAAYIDTGAARILSSSPERFLRLEGARAQTRPIKGTRPRGKTREEDARLRDELARSGKDRAENVMIVDLLRNDFSRVCLPGSVSVTGLCGVEQFPTVFHLTSTVEGILRPGLGPVDLLRASFPGGSVTGAPKIRAMEIIDEIEPVQRGVYCGAMGYIGFDGDMDLGVAIRTMVHAAGRYSFHAGGAVTWPSDPAAEYQETIDKAGAMLRAVE